MEHYWYATIRASFSVVLISLPGVSLVTGGRSPSLSDNGSDSHLMYITSVSCTLLIHCSLDDRLLGDVSNKLLLSTAIMENADLNLPPNIKLVAHATARNATIATQAINAGSVIVSSPSYASILLRNEKGSRCDACFRRAIAGNALRRCSGCGSYWYCDDKCAKGYSECADNPF